MSSIKPPPFYAPMVEMQPVGSQPSGLAAGVWTEFFNALYTGDTGTNWTPTFVSLGSTGTPTINGKYYRISRNLVFFTVTIIPTTDTTSTAGTTYIDNFPLNIRGSSVCLAAIPSTGIGGSSGVIDAASGRIFTPAWTTVTQSVIVVGMMEAQ